jgi:hypothetical protein
MKHLLRSRFALVVAVAALVLPAGASAAPASTSFAIVGYEYAGDTGDTAAWNTRVEHDPLGSTPTYVNGGTFQMATRSPSWHVDTVTGTFVHQGGMITTLNSGPNCTNQQFRVTGRLQNVSTTTTSGGTGTFAATLTHFRTSLFGRCVIYKARVAGTVAFAY